MSDLYSQFIAKHSLELEKVVEHTVSGCLEFIFRTGVFTDPDLLAAELRDVFPFAGKIKVTLHDKDRPETVEPEISPLWKGTPEAEKFLGKDGNGSKDGASGATGTPAAEAQETDWPDPEPDPDSFDDPPPDFFEGAPEDYPIEENPEPESKEFDLTAYQAQKLKQKEREIQSFVPPETHGPEEADGTVDVVLTPGMMITGKPFTETARPMGDIDFSDFVHEKNVCLEGTIFSVEKNDISDKSFLYTVAFTDHTGSIYLKQFVSKKKSKEVAAFDKYVVNGNQIKVLGDLEYDDFVKDRIIKSKAIMLDRRRERVDKAPEKRVELHMHTQYSSMDAVSKVKDIVARAKAFGHDAIGITDHGVLQAFPELMNATKGTDIQVLYGLEGYLVDTESKIVKGSKNEPFDGEFIFFDLETTGTSVYTDKVIEIAAVLMKDGVIKDTYDTFVNPHEKLRRVIVDLTGITDQMVAEGKEEDEAFQGLIDFIDGRVIAAHNATFDTAFLKRWCEKTGTEYAFTVIDSLPLARAVVPEIARFNMGRLCSFFKIKNEHAHRAIEDSIASAKVLVELFKRAQERGATGVADLNGLIDTQVMAKKNTHTNHVVIYPKNLDGLYTLYELVSDSHLKYFSSRPRIPKVELASKRENLIIGSACASGELFEALVDEAPDSVLMDIASFYDYLEVQPIGNNAFLLKKDSRITEETLKDYNRKIIEIGEKTGKPVVATGDVHFVDPEDAIFREVLQVNGRGSDGPQPPLYYRNTEEMLAEFDYIPKDKAYEIVVLNPRKIKGLMDPIKPIPDGTYPPVIEGAEEEIREMAVSKAHRIYGDELPEIVQKRMDRELDSIINNGYAVLYLIAQKLVRHSEEDGFLVGSRGSVGSSFVAFLCDITEVNSLPAHYICPNTNCKHSEFVETDLVGPDLEDRDCPVCGTRMRKDGYDIPFETFLGFEGDKEPDIDLNFSGDNQAEAHAYTEVLFGKGKTFRAGTISTLAEKTAYGYVRKYFDVKDKTVSKAEIERLKIGCTGVKRTTGQHPGGIMVVPRDKEIFEFTPIQHPADDAESDTITTHFDYHSISGRLLKLDILGHDDPTMLRHLQNMTGVNPRSIPLDDRDVISLFTGTDSLHFVRDCDLELGTIGIPEFGTSFVRQMVKETKPNALTDLIRISGLSHGTDVWTDNAQAIIKRKQATIKDVIATRDDIMLGLISYGLESKESFTIMESVRKGKGLASEFEDDMRANNVPEWYIESCKKIQYLFPKAHAVAYVIMALRIAWFKIHYPLEYYACYFGIRAKEFDLKTISSGYEAIVNEMGRLKELNRNGGMSNKEAQSMVSLELALEMYCRGFECQRVDLKKSHASQFRVEGNSIIPPFTAVSGIGAAAAKSLYDALQQGPIISQDEILLRSKLSKSNLATLEEMGCLEGIPKTNQVSFF